MVKLFEYNTCECLPECHAERYEIVSHQYGSLSLKDHRIMVEGEVMKCILYKSYTMNKKNLKKHKIVIQSYA